MPNIRKGKGYKWTDSNLALAGDTRVTSGFTIDNLDTKTLSDANNEYERIFILVREIFEKNTDSLSSKETRLQCVQDITDTIFEQRTVK